MCSTPSMPPNEDQHILELPILHKIILQRSDIHSFKCPKRVNKQNLLFLIFSPFRYEGDKCGDLFHEEGVAYFQGGHVYKVILNLIIVG